MLAIDIGNTAIKTGTFTANGELKEFKRFPTESLILLKEAMVSAGMGIISNVSALNNQDLQHTGFIILNNKTRLPIVLDYDQPETLGTDRIALACGAQKMAPHEPSLTIGMGTCITYDFLDQDGKYHGGAIAPGLKMRYKALQQFTGKLPLVDHRAFEGYLGSNTETSILAGVQRGIEAEINAWISHYESEFDGIKIFLTGGDAGILSLSAQNRIFAVPELLLQGLFAIYNHNAS